MPSTTNMTQISNDTSALSSNKLVARLTFQIVEVKVMNGPTDGWVNLGQMDALSYYLCDQ